MSNSSHRPHQPHKPLFPFQQCLDDDAIILPNFQQFANSGDYNCPEKSIDYYQKVTSYKRPPRQQAVHIPEQHYYMQSKSEGPDAHRDRSSKTYEHPIKFERRLMKQTINSLARAPHLLSDCKEEIRSKPRIQFIPLRQHKREKLEINDVTLGKLAYRTAMFLDDPNKDGFRYGTTVPIKEEPKRDGWLYIQNHERKSIAVPSMS